MPLDFRSVEALSPLQEAMLAHFRKREFQWVRWTSQNPDWTHDHCQLCNACICNHREDYPHEKAEQEYRGCYRHAYVSNPESPTDGSPIWLCRNCWKRTFLGLSTPKRRPPSFRQQSK